MALERLAVCVHCLGQQRYALGRWHERGGSTQRVAAIDQGIAGSLWIMLLWSMCRVS